MLKAKKMKRNALAGLSILWVSFSGLSEGANTSIYGPPSSFAKVLAKPYSPALTLSSGGITTNRGRYLISTASAASTGSLYLSIGLPYSDGSGYPVVSSSIPSASTYNNYFSKLIQVVANSTDSSGYYRLDSHLNPNQSIDVDKANGYVLKFRNNRGKASPTYGYVAFSYDTTTNLLRAQKRYTYSLASTTTSSNGNSITTYTGSYTEDTSFSAAGAGYYVSYSGGVFSLTPTASSATKLYLFSSSDGYGIASGSASTMNPTGISYGPNPPAPFPTAVSVSAIEAGFSKNLNSTYQPQVTVSGPSSKTRIYAQKLLSSIDQTNIRYSKDLYTNFRDAALAGKLVSDAPADGQVGQNLVPYVYFTNEKDTSGVYHPFMNVVTYTNPGSPHGLLDVPGPPFLGAGGTTTPVTRASNIGMFIARIPMRNYGQVTNVTDNAMNPSSQSWSLNLVTDSGCGTSGSSIPTCPSYDNYNYASTADNGILIDGSIIFPTLNNALIPSQWKGELSTYGCHVGQGGGGPHCHADAFKTGQSIVTLYNDSDYVGKTHPPLIGFGYDGVALFGVYRSSADTTMLGYSTALDSFGGHNHDGIGYHYHAHVATMPSTYNQNSNGFKITASQSPVNVLLKGAWAGNINSVPFFPYNADFKTNKYLGGM